VLCEAETCRARWRLVVQGGDFSYETETFRARRRLVGGVAIRLRTGRLASEGLDEDLHALLETQC
jgi:hypothetical protein